MILMGSTYFGFAQKNETRFSKYRIELIGHCLRQMPQKYTQVYENECKQCHYLLTERQNREQN